MNKEMYETIKKGIMGAAAMMNNVNKVVPVNGERITIPLEARNLEVVYYKAKSNNAPVMFSTHGGGFLLGGSALDDNMLNTIRNVLDVNIISIDYRKTPDYRYPCALEDTYDSIKYFLQHDEEYSFDGKKVIVYGSSAGANLAASACILAKERNEIQIGLQILNYPYLDLAKNPIEKEHTEDELPMYDLFPELYADLEKLKDPHISPIYAMREQLICLPEAIITVAENDSLNSEGNIYIQMLKEAGVKVTERVAKRMPHGYFETSYTYQEEGAFIIESIKPLIEDGSLLEEQKETLEFIRKAYEEWKRKY